MPEQTLVAVDTGGTFTDFVFIGSDGALSISKRPSIPGDPAQSIIDGLREAREAETIIGRYELFHGTTVATNALLERKGARTALITTQGFRDVLEIGRQARAQLYTLNPGRPAPLLDREDRHELYERVGWRGNVLTPINETGRSN